MSTMQSGDVPEILRSHLPKYGALIDKYVDDLGESVNYPLLGELFIRLCEAFDENSVDDADVKAFFHIVERGLVEGDDSAKDLFALEVIEYMYEPRVKHLGLERFLGPCSYEEWRKFGEYLGDRNN